MARSASRYPERGPNKSVAGPVVRRWLEAILPHPRQAFLHRVCAPGAERRATACATRTRGSMVGGCGAC